MFKKLKRKIEFTAVLKAVFSLAAMMFLNNVGTRGEPFAAALYFAMLLSGSGVAATGIIYLLSFSLTFGWTKIVAMAAQTLVLSVIYGTFGKKKRLGLMSLVFLPASLVPYILIDGAEFYLPRLIAVSVITVVAAAIYPAVLALKVKGFRRPEALEAFSLAVAYVAVWTGGIKYIGADGYRAVSLLFLACAAVLLGGGESCLFSFVFALPAAIYTKSAVAFAPYLLFGAVSFVFARGNRAVYAATLIASELASAYLFGWYGDYSYISLIYMALALLAFVPIPEKLFSRGAEALSLASDKPLSRYEINRTRALISGRLYEISGTFREISNLFGTLSKTENPFAYEDAIIEETDRICASCSFSKSCRASSFPSREELTRLIAIAKGKGRLTAVDLPKKFSDRCVQNNKMIFAINKYVNLYGAEIEKRKAAGETRELVGLQADGVASALKGMAKTMSKSLSYRLAKERKLSADLIKRGVNVQEVMIFGEGEGTEVHMILGGPKENVIPHINEFFKAKFAESERFDLPGGRVALVLERACKYDCMFGVSSRRKSGESACGDTHTLIKLSRNKFMLALSDGMGSGETAHTTSSASLSLIECFYRAGLPGEVALNTVNRLLSFAGEDNFAALDLAVINLENLSCDFIKLGAPYGFIVSKGSVRLIEGSSLPMGILDELKPSVCTEPVQPGDVILFVSDGVTDAFGSATDFADFLTAASVSNPQRLADKILREAFALYGNAAADDMTVVACKIFAS